MTTPAHQEEAPQLAPKEVRRKFQESLRSEYASRQFHLEHPDFCDNTMKFFDRMSDLAEKAATKDDLEQHMHVVTDVLSRQTNRINDQDRRINGIDSRVRQLEELTIHIKIAVDANTAIANQNLLLSKSISESVQQIKKSSTIPAIAYPVMGVVAIALIAAATGQMAEFIGWLSTIKILGCVVNPLDVVAIGAKLIDKLIPDPAAKAAAQLELVKLQQSGQLEELKLSLSAIISDSQSADPWTSRARPTFLYVVYILLLWSLPMGAMFVFYPDAAARFTNGFGLWLAAIPEPILMLFGTVMLGYVGGRTFEKIKGAAK